MVDDRPWIQVCIVDTKYIRMTDDERRAALDSEMTEAEARRVRGEATPAYPQPPEPNSWPLT